MVMEKAKKVEVAGIANNAYKTFFQIQESQKSYSKTGGCVEGNHLNLTSDTLSKRKLHLKTSSILENQRLHI